MPSSHKTLDEVMSEKGVSGWYTWRPNQIWTRDPEDPSKYMSTDVVIDGTIDAVISDLKAARDQQLALIESAGEDKIEEIKQIGASYPDVKDIALQTFYSLRSLFSQYQMAAAITIVNNAIDRINDLDLNGGADS